MDGFAYQKNPGAGIDVAARAISAYNRGESQGAGRAGEVVTAYPSDARQTGSRQSKLRRKYRPRLETMPASARSVSDRVNAYSMRSALFATVRPCS